VGRGNDGGIWLKVEVAMLSNAVERVRVMVRVREREREREKEREREREGGAVVRCWWKAGKPL